MEGGRLSIESKAGPDLPRVGDGVTYGAQPGTIVRVGTNGRYFWFQLDAVREAPDGGARFVPDPYAMTYGALLEDDGVWRESYTRGPVAVGLRRLSTDLSTPAPLAGTLAALASRAGALTPTLLKRRWYPMSYMGIPSVLKAADALLLEIARFEAAGAEEEKAVAALFERFARLRAGFRNFGGGESPAPRPP